MNNFKELKVWQKSIQFIADIYKFTSSFPDFEKYGISSQLQRASVSISSNIAEGCGKKSAKDFNRFLQIAKSSAYEVENLIIVCNNLSYLEKEDYNKLINDIQEIQKMLTRLMKSLKI